MRRLFFLLCSIFLLSTASARAATIFGQIQGIVHDAQHRPIGRGTVTVHAAHSAYTRTAFSNMDGVFSLPGLPLGDYTVSVTERGFRAVERTITLASDTTPVLHFELPVGAANETVVVTAGPDAADVNSVTPTTLVGRLEIAETPGADRTNSLAMITDYVPGAYITHDMLHIRGGHQVSWLLDGVQIPNTNIASNLGAQIDPKDI